MAETEEQAKARRRAEREAELERRRAAVAFNLELGVAVVKAFAKVRLDERVLRVLTAVDFKDDLDALAARGARYGFPGWPVEETTAGGKAKTTYLERYQAHAKAREYLEGAKAPGEIAGRCLALVVMAVARRRDLRRAVQPLLRQPQRLHRRQLRDPGRDAARAAVAPAGPRARRGARARAPARAPHRHDPRTPHRATHAAADRDATRPPAGDTAATDDPPAADADVDAGAHAAA